MGASVEQSLRKAKKFERAGQIAQAVTCYRKVLAAFPANTRAQKALTRLTQAQPGPPAAMLHEIHSAYQRGQMQAACDQARALTAPYPTSEPLWTLLGASAAALGQLEEARDAFGHAIRLKPDAVTAQANLGAVHERLGAPDKAAACFTRALVLAPGNAGYLLSRGNAHLALGQLPNAMADITASIDAAPNNPLAHISLAHVMRRQGQTPGAIAAFERALHLAPDNTDAVIGLAEALTDSGQAPAALDHLRAALQQDPENPSLLLCLGTTCLEAGDPGAAIPLLEQARAQDPTSVKVLNNLASARFAMGDTGVAADDCLAAIRLDPGHARAHHNLANIRQQTGQLDQAIESYAQAIHLDPTLHAAQAQKLHFQAQICDWRGQEEFNLVADTLGITGAPISPFAVLAHEDHPARQLARSRRYARQWAQPRHGFPAAPAKSRLRVGYVSGDLYDHATLFLLNGVLEHHDPTQFDIYIYGLNPRRDSAQFDRLADNVTKVVDLHQASDAQIIAQARADGLDIAIDLKGYTQGARPALFASGLAPVQVNYLGYPGSMGMAAMDYIIADPFVIPPEERAHYTENIIYLPDSYQPNDDQRVIADQPLCRADHGLPDQGVVLCCFNQNYKISKPVFDIWMRVLAQCDDSVLWLMEGTPWARENLRHAARERGVSPERLIFAPKLPQDQHLARHRLADLFVDTFHYNAHTTASDALYAGLPVVTRPGAQFAARVAGSLLSAVGLPDLIASDDPSYEQMILDLVTTPAALADIRARLAANLATAPLFDTARYTRHLEAGFRAAWEIWQAGQTARDIHVPRQQAGLQHTG